MKAWLEENNKDAQVFVSDPAKGYNDDMGGIDIAFLQIHVPTEDDGTQDLTLMAKLIKGLPDVPVFVRTTILPGTSERLSRETGRQVCYMPEFLSERTHIEDFRNQTMVFSGAVDLLAKVFPGKKYTVMSPLEAELTSTSTMSLAHTRSRISMRRRSMWRRWVAIGRRCMPELCFPATSMTRIRMSLVRTASTATAASASQRT